MEVRTWPPNCAAPAPWAWRIADIPISCAIWWNCWRRRVARALGGGQGDGGNRFRKLFLLLRLKALLGDREPEVLSGCLIGLLDIDGADALPLAGSLARSRPEVREAGDPGAGESWRNDAIDWLRQHFDEVADGETKKCILLSLASSRTEAAVDFLLELIRDGSAAAAELAFSAMSIHRDDPRLRDLIGKAMDSRAAR